MTKQESILIVLLLAACMRMTHTVWHAREHMAKQDSMLIVLLLAACMIHTVWHVTYLAGCRCC